MENLEYSAFHSKFKGTCSLNPKKKKKTTVLYVYSYILYAEKTQNFVSSGATSKS